MDKGRKLETVVGFFVLVIAIFFFNYVYQKSGWDSSEGYVLNAVFEKAEGLAEGVDVKISGVRVGKILSTSVDPKTFMANVKFYVSSDMKLPKDTSAAIQTEGLLGSKYLALIPGMEEEVLNANDTICDTSSGIDLGSLIGQFMFSKKEEKQNDSPADFDFTGTEPIRDDLVPEETKQGDQEMKIVPIETNKSADSLEGIAERGETAEGIAAEGGIAAESVAAKAVAGLESASTEASESASMEVTENKEAEHQENAHTEFPIVNEQELQEPRSEQKVENTL